MTKFKKIIEYLFYTYIFLLPWQARWIFSYGQLGDEISQYLTLSLYGTEILFVLVIILAIIYQIKNPDPKGKNQEKKDFNIRIFSFYILAVLFLIFLAISLFFAADKIVGLFYFLKIIEGFLIFALFLNFDFHFYYTGVVIICSAAVQGGLGIYQFLIQHIWGSKYLGMATQYVSEGGASVVESETMRWLRAYGSFSHPNILGGFLAISLIILLTVLILTIFKPYRILFWLTLPLIFSGLFFTFSKSAFLAFAVGLLFMIIFILVSRIRPAISTLIQFLLLIVINFSFLAIIYAQPLTTRLTAETRLEIQSQTERLNYFEQARSLIEQNWFTGVGPGNYTLELYQSDFEKSKAWDYQPVHNVFVLILAEAGILSFVFFILFLINIFREIYYFRIDQRLGLLEVFSQYKSNEIYYFYKLHYFWFIGLTACFLAMIVIMFFDHYFWTQYFGLMMWWLVLGMWLKMRVKAD